MTRRTAVWLSVVPMGALILGGLLRMGVFALTTLGVSLQTSIAVLLMVAVGLSFSFALSIRCLLPIVNEYHAAYGEPTLDLSMRGLRASAWLWLPMLVLAVAVAVVVPDAGWAFIAVLAGLVYRIVMTLAAAVAAARSA